VWKLPVEPSPWTMTLVLRSTRMLTVPSLRSGVVGGTW
jgi:hypothetical protein